MANLILTTNCQRKCEYCFAVEDRDKHISFSWDNFIKAVKFISSGYGGVNLLGGEPTLHPDFIRMLEYLIVNDFSIQVFTNGLLDKVVSDKLSDLLCRTSLRTDQLLFAVNVSTHQKASEAEACLQKKFFESFGSISYPSFTIHEDIDLKFLHELVLEYTLIPYIRLGLALPVIGGKNKHLPISEYSKIAKRIVELSDNSEGTTLTFDCGFPLCMFDMSDIGRLNSNSENDFAFICGQPIDIYPDLSVTNCYPLSKVFRGNIDNFKNFNELNSVFIEGFRTPHGIYGKKCSDCTFFMKACFGGCKGFYKPDGGE